MTAKSKAKAKSGHGGPRANSGGKREGSGRKPSRLPAEKLETVGPMPDNPLEVAEWGRKLNGIVLEGLATGLPWKDLSKHIDRGLRTTMDLVQLEIRSKAIAARVNEGADDSDKMTPRAPDPKEPSE